MPPRHRKPTKREQIFARCFWFVLSLPFFAVAGMLSAEWTLTSPPVLVPTMIGIGFVFLASVVPARISVWLASWFPRA